MERVGSDMPFTLTKAQREKVENAKLVASTRMDELDEEINRIALELEHLNKMYAAAHNVCCRAVNMLNGVLKFDDNLLEIK